MDDDDAACEAEGRVLVREVQDAVSHQLSNVWVQLMGHREVDDPEELRAVLRVVERSVEAALAELRLLARVLGAAGAAVDETELSASLALTDAAARWTEVLAAAGLDPTVDVLQRADEVGSTLQRTLVRALDVVGAELLSSTSAPGRCEVVLHLGATQAVLRATLPAPAPVDGLGPDLSGLRTRVRLLGGSLVAGPAGAARHDDAAPRPEDDWVVVVTLPLD